LQGASYADQLAGKRIANKETFNAAGQKLLSDWADWNAYKLVQPNPDGFTIHKRTNPQSCWLDVLAGPAPPDSCSQAMSPAAWQRACATSGIVSCIARSPRRHHQLGVPSRLDVVAGRAPDGPAPLRHARPRSGFVLRRRAARLQHAARNRAAPAR
jgi:hypothetical protein